MHSLKISWSGRAEVKTKNNIGNIHQPVNKCHILRKLSLEVKPCDTFKYILQVIIVRENVTLGLFMA
ncbi:hypothetical protein CW311_14040 [Acinetobacter proteolyticus]|uniref:Uncharacterized protein n=1 Tax=Acinetobacter proteolyticus TaxID=1776741 RepID=A0A2N0WCP4_9GAMM|nr:hypothetical protein CW311_14040 [Acinetobacter proteolyticus]